MKKFNTFNINIKNVVNNIKVNIHKFKDVVGNRKISIVVTSIILLFAILSINIGASSKKDVLQEFKNGLLSKKPEQIARYVRVNNKEVSAKKLEPLIKYYDGNEEKISNLINSLTQNGKSEFFSLESKKKFLKEKYYISVSVVAIDFTSDFKKVKISLLDKWYNLDDKSSFFVIPGVYDVKYTLKTEYGEVSGITNVAAIEDNSVNIDVDAKFITLYSNFSDADVYIDGEKTNLKVQDIKNYGPIPRENNLTLHIEREFPWGNIKSEEVTLNGDSFIKIDLNMVNNNLSSTINQITNSFYSSTFDALNNKDSDFIVNCTQEVKEKVFNYINEKTLLLGNNYNITDLYVEIEKSDFKFEDQVYKASLVTNIKYNVSKKILPFVKTTNESSFLLFLEYRDDKFIVNEIQKIDI